jgi:hypothetical protein
MKKIFLIFLQFIVFLMLYPLSYAQTIEVTGNVSENITWSADTVKVIGDVVVNENVTLTIASGTWVKFQGNYGIEINGYLIAEGVPGDTIIFTRTDTLGFMNYSDNKGGWKGLAFRLGGVHADTSRLSICKISFVKCIENNYGAVSIYDDHNLNIKGCVIENNFGEYGAGVLSSGTKGANTLIEDCLIRNNFTNNHGGGIYGSYKIRIKNNVITNNHAKQWGGGIYVGYCDDIISDNIITYNYAEYSGGGINNRYGSPRIERNVFEYNQTDSEGGGLRCGNYSRMKIINNRFTNNTAKFGGGIQIRSSEPEIINNIINNNEASIEGGGISLEVSDAKVINNTICNNLGANGGGLYCENSESALNNNIIWNNSAGSGNQIYIRDNFSSPDIFYSTIQDGTGGFGLYSSTTYQGSYQNNLETNPLFADPFLATGIQLDAPDADWRVLTYSPCINSGNPDLTGMNIPLNDILGNDRISHGRIDMGAIETLISKISVVGTIPSDSVLVADTVEVTGDIIIPDSVTLTIAPGTQVLFNGHFKIDVNGRLLAQGTRSDTICFTIKNNTGFYDFESTDGSWDGIDFNNGLTGANGAMNDNDTSFFSYCHISYAKTLGHGGAFYINHFSKIRFDHCVIENNATLTDPDFYYLGGGLYIDDSNPYLKNCRISRNFAYGGGAIWGVNSDFIIESSVITRNACIPANGLGASIYIGRSSPLILNCDIINNNNEAGSASGIKLDHSDAVIINCRITNNKSTLSFLASAVYSEYGKPLLINNLIANNTQYATKFINAEDAILVNNTIVNNVSYGLIFDHSVSHVYNTILWGNTSGQISFKEEYGTGNDINFYNCIIKDGINATFFDKGYINDYYEIQDVSPGFIQPSAGAGIDFDGLGANWALDIFSPCINSGTLDIPDVTMPSTDLTGQPRINSTSIDIGAYEDQGGPVTITINPYGGSKCEGDSITFYIEVDDQVTYQWQRNNIDIPGADSSYLTINPVESVDEGVYRCIVSNAYGNFSSGEAYLIVKSPPEILVEPLSSWLEINKTVNLSVITTGSIPMTYQWKKDNASISGANSPEYVISKTDYSDEGAYSCVITNSCGEVETTPAVLYLVPQICMVTVDPLTGHNLVIWEKKSKALIDTFNVYRESKAAGIYDLMGKVSHEDLSIFVDTTADPTVQAYLYKITGVDSSGYETDIDLCKPHKTIHLLVSTNPELNTTQLEWDKYYGFEYQTYNILRSPTGTNFTQVHALASSLASWTDPDPLPDVGYYRITVEKPDPCYPTGESKKADAGPYSHSMSNMEDNRLQEVLENQAPTDISLTDNTIAENQSIGTLVGRLETTDADTADHHTYKLVSGSGDTDNNMFTTLGDLLITAGILDYETKDTLYVRVKSTDKGDLSVEESFFILVTDVNEGAGNLAPTDISLSFNSIYENKPVGTLIGKFQTTDPNEGDMHTYGLVEGLGADDNNSFILLGDALLSGEQFDYETKGEYTIRVRSRDDGDGRLSFEKSFTIYVNDLLETGLTDNRIENRGLDIYPNPFSNKTIIQFENPAGVKYQMYITDLTGKVVYFEDNIFSNHIEFSREGLPDGYYFVELRGTGVYRGKIVLE